MSRAASPIILTDEERTTLRGWERGRSLPHRQVIRAKIVLMAAHDMRNQEIATTLKVSRPTVQLWRGRFLALRLPGLEQDAPRPGRKARIPAEKVRAVVEATLHTTPPGATHWSTRSMAKAQNLSQAAVHRIWKQHNLKPHLVKTFKLSRDKHFVEKLCDIVGLYLNPPDKALVLCVDEKSQIQALDRTQPGLPLKKGRCGTMTHDYKRYGTTTLFAALNMLDGKVIGDCMPRHRHQEFIRFLKKIDRVKKRFVEEGFDFALEKRKGDRVYIKKADGDFEAHLVALSCGSPPEGFSRWSLRLLADKAAELNYIDSISHEAVRRILKKTNLSLGGKKGG